MKKLFFTFCLCLVALSADLIAQATLSVQGTIQKSFGAAVDDGDYSLTFKLYTAATGGTEVWSETQGAVDITGGVYSVVLGSVNPLTAAFNQTYYLGIAVDGGTELTPRAQLTSSPYALSLIGQSNIFPSTGGVGIGELSPAHLIHLKSGSPTIAFQDTDNRSGFIHQNADLMHFLSGGVNANSWAINGGYWPLTLNMANDAATFGGPAYFMEGNVGIGTASPSQKLVVAGGNMDVPNGWISTSGIVFAGGGLNTNGPVNLNSGGANSKLTINAGPNTGLDLSTANSMAEMRIIRNTQFSGDKDMYIQWGSTGNTLLYGGSTEKIKLTGGTSNLNGNWDVSGRLNITGSALTGIPAGSFFNFAAYTNGPANHFGPVGASNQVASIYAANSIISGNAFMAVSDRRIKKNFRLSNKVNDLSSLLQLQVTDYRKIDRVNYGDEYMKGFIAQEVEQVYPEAISLTSDFIPNVYEVATNSKKEGDVLSISLNKKHDFAAGDEVKLIFPDGEKTMMVADVISDQEFTVEWTETSPEKVFVFGKKVDDFHTVDYDRIFTLNVSATQELAAQVEQLQKELSAARAENAALRDDMNDRLVKLESMVTASAQK